jgi:NAD(P)-dependent dehydrogenase (short-subunit alcohol dehydrogenase family)
MDDLRDKTVIVTGAAGGIGQAIVERFRSAGSRVIAVDIDTTRLAHLADDKQVALVEADVSSGEDADRIIATATGRLDVLVNNAAVLDRLAPVDETTDEQWRHVLEINLTGPFLLCARAVPRMLEQGGGVIVNIGSLAALRGGRAGAAYTASKHGLLGLTRNIAATLGNRGIRANTLCPGGIPTGMARGGQVSERGATLSGRDRDRPGPGKPEEIASVAAFLASDESSRINGAELAVDGGSAAF